MKSILVLTGLAGKDKAYKVKPDIVKTDLKSAVDQIINEIAK